MAADSWKTSGNRVKTTVKKTKLTYCEMETLIEALERFPELAIGKANKNETYKTLGDLRQAWDKITTIVNTSCSVNRSAHEIKQKWLDMKTRAKMKVSKIMETGGSLTTEDALKLMYPLERRIAYLMKDTYPKIINCTLIRPPALEEIAVLKPKLSQSFPSTQESWLPGLSRVSTAPVIKIEPVSPLKLTLDANGYFC